MPNNKVKYNIEESKNWNNSKRYSESKIMEILEEIDEYEITSEFGYKSPDEMIDNYKISDDELNYRKIEAFRFLVSKMIQLLSNADFAIEKKRKEFTLYLNTLEEIQSKLKKLYIKKSYNKVKIKKSYYVILKLVKQIKREMNIPLNKNSLIYKSVEEIDIEEQIDADREDFRNNP